MSHPLAVLDGYRIAGPEAPLVGKIHRMKDRHDSGTGRRDRVKRDGRGLSNWGNPLDDALAVDDYDVPTYEEEPIVEAPGRQIILASDFFGEEEDDDYEPVSYSRIVKVPRGYGQLVQTEGNVVIEGPVETTKATVVVRRGRRRTVSDVSGEFFHLNAEVTKAGEKRGVEAPVRKVKVRNQKFRAVQHNRTRVATDHRGQ